MNEEKQLDQKILENPDHEQKRSALKVKKEWKFFKKKENADPQTEEKNVRWVQIRLIPIWLRVVLTVLLLVITGVVGLYIGYSVLGDGAPNELFKKETWTHITDIIQGIE